jgi:hypothetical protein
MSKLATWWVMAALAVVAISANIAKLDEKYILGGSREYIRCKINKLKLAELSKYKAVFKS